MRRFFCLLFLSLVISSVAMGQSGLRLPAIIGDNMVLQQNLANPIWGWADPGATVEVRVAGQSVETVADETGRWRTKLAPMAGSFESHRMTIRSGGETIAVSNILVGEVWVCSGQSNMQWAVRVSNDADLEIATADYPHIRMITVPQVGTQELQDDFNGRWDVCTPETVADFSAIGYFFGRQLYQSIDVPIGLIDNAWGGSSAEAWVARDVLRDHETFAETVTRWEGMEADFDFDAEMAKWEKDAAAARQAGKKVPQAPRNILTGQHRPGNLWAGVTHPIIGYGIRGTIWYQGESNASRAASYEELFSLLISEWRRAWGQGDFPFYWVQLADFQKEVEAPGESNWAELREAQTGTLSLPNTGQAVIHDLGEGRDIHPRDKQNVAKRLARIALARDYGWEISYQSPSFASMEIVGAKVVATFGNVGSTLYAFDTAEVVGFAVAGADRVWHPATGKLLDRERVEVSSPAVSAPVAIRYAWANNPVANLTSREGLPVVPFRTDDWLGGDQ